MAYISGLTPKSKRHVTDARDAGSSDGWRMLALSVIRVAVDDLHSRDDFLALDALRFLVLTAPHWLEGFGYDNRLVWELLSRKGQ